jgi:Uma2 family endonuclease
MVAQAKTRVTFDEYAALPETNHIIELIDGEMVVHPPKDQHQKILWNIVATLMPLLASGEARFAPTGLHFDDGNSFEPDVFWVSAENDHCVLEDNGRFWHGAPDLVVEVLSPSTEANDRGDKFDTYEQYGVREYWLVSPEGQFTEVYRHENGRFNRVGLFRAEQPFVSTVLGANIDSRGWYAGGQ